MINEKGEKEMDIISISQALQIAGQYNYFSPHSFNYSGTLLRCFPKDQRIKAS